MTETITLTYTPDAALVRAASKRWHDLQSIWIRVLGRGLMVGLGLVVWIIVELVFGYDIQISHLVAALVGVLIVTAKFEFMNWRQRQFEKSHGPGTVETTLRLGQSKIVIEDETGTGTYTWPYLSEVGQMDGATVLQFGAYACPVPDDAIGNQMTPTEFRARLTQWREAAT